MHEFFVKGGTPYIIRGCIIIQMRHAYIAKNKQRIVAMILGWIFMGLIAGALARLLTPGSGPQGCVVTILLGIAGALLAGYAGRVAGLYGQEDRAGLIAATLGACAILFIYRKLSK